MRLWVRDDLNGGWLDFSRGEVVFANSLEEVLPLLEQVEAHVADGGFAAGYIAYDAAPALDPALVVRRGDGPLAWFALVIEPVRFVPPISLGTPIQLTPTLNLEQYTVAFDRVQKLLQDGETYQVNFTFPLTATGDARDFWPNCRDARFGAWLEDDDWRILSASPECFVQWRDGVIWSEPMKGTRPPGLGQDLAESAKDQAENLMIVDMIRNDLGRIARRGSVRVPHLFRIEEHPTVTQMTSRVVAETDAPFTEIFTALFPCASITGAPKIHTSRIIASLENAPRGVYTGAIGWVGPGCGQFSVAIRTLVETGGKLTYGVGSGLVVDSQADSEYNECLLKGAILQRKVPFPGQVLETMRMKEGEIPRLDAHIARAQATSLTLFGEALQIPIQIQLAGSARVRMTARPGEAPTFEQQDLGILPDVIRLRLADHHVYSEDLALRHKTTARAVYEQFPITWADDVLLFNERGEVTETTRFNVAALIDGQWVSPPLSCGLLPGVMRKELAYPERVIYARELSSKTPLRVFNSVRGEHPAMLVVDLG